MFVPGFEGPGRFRLGAYPLKSELACYHRGSNEPYPRARSARLTKQQVLQAQQRPSDDATFFNTHLSSTIPGSADATQKGLPEQILQCGTFY